MKGSREGVNMVGWLSEATGTFGALVENAEPGDARERDGGLLLWWMPRYHKGPAALFIFCKKSFDLFSTSNYF